MNGVVGLDIGGANLKGAHTDGSAHSIPFPLWREPERLAHKLRELLASLPEADVLAVTMTGELCDCFVSRRDGVLAIVDALENAAGGRQVHVWTTSGTFVDLAGVRGNPLDAAAANWLALAAAVTPLAENDTGLLVDIGSTTTDIVPLLGHAGSVSDRGSLADPERLRRGELVYTGVRRTPLCALLGFAAAGELFATTLDVYLALGLVPEDAADIGTADGRPATSVCAHARLARMLCGDADSISVEETRRLAERAFDIQIQYLARSVERVAREMPARPGIVIASGSGGYLVGHVLRTAAGFAGVRLVSLADVWTPKLADAACAYAVALLGQKEANAATSPGDVVEILPSPPERGRGVGGEVGRRPEPRPVYAAVDAVSPPPHPLPFSPGVPAERGAERARVSRLVVKVGGSLFDLVDLGTRLRDFLACRLDEQVLIVPGGGPLADSIRTLDNRHRLGEERSHWLALQTLAVNAHFLASLLPDIPIIGGVDELASQKCVIVDMYRFAHADEGQGGSLPHHWDVSSDSLAVRLACRAGATDCLLFKSVSCRPVSWREAADLGLVDRYFPQLMNTAPSELRVQLVNFRSTGG